MVKVTYSLDKTTVRQIRRTADRRGISRAHVVGKQSPTTARRRTGSASVKGSVCCR